MLFSEANCWIRILLGYIFPQDFDVTQAWIPSYHKLQLKVLWYFKESANFLTL